LASNLVWLWPAWALLQAAHVVNSELGLVPMTVLLCLCSAIGLSVVAYALSEPSRRTGGSGNPPWPLPCSGQPIPPTRPATPDPIVQQSFEIACEEAARLGHDYVGTEHMLLGLLKLTKGSFADLLRSLNLDSDLVRTQIERIVTPILVRPGTAELPLTPRARKALKIAIKEAKAQTHLGMRAEHIFLGLLLEGSGVAARALKNLGVRTEKVREAIGVNELRAD
jgi:hypothetical protein